MTLNAGVGKFENRLDAIRLRIALELETKNGKSF